MSKNKIWILSDLHLGARNHSIEWLNIMEDYFFNFFIPLVKDKKNKNDKLVICGDVFDNRQVISLFTINSSIRIFEALSDIFTDIRIIVGNHDIAKKNENDVCSIDILKHIKNITIYKDPYLDDIFNKKVLFIPWRRNSEHELETIKEYPNANIVFSHSETKGLRMNSNPKIINEHGNSIEIFKKYDLIFSGHIHWRQELNNFIMVGNPYQMTRSDTNNKKGVYCLDPNTMTYDFFENNYSPEFKQIVLTDDNFNDFKKIRSTDFVDLKIDVELYNNPDVNKKIEEFSKKYRKFDIYVNEKTLLLESNENIQISSNEYDLSNISSTYIENIENISTETKNRLKTDFNTLLKEAQYENSIN
jgi:DNA repair exonuclease SbcCD nuclease subunit